MRYNQSAGFEDPKEAAAQLSGIAREAYSTLDDPRSFESRMKVAQVLHTAFPNISRRDAYDNYEGIIKAATGYSVDSGSAWNDFVETFASSANNMKAAGIMYGSLMKGQTTGDYNSAFDEGLEQVGKLKIGKRTDYKDYSGIIDAFMQAGNILPSTLTSIAIEGAGIGLGALVGHPVAGKIAGRAANAASVYMQEAGSEILDLASVRDDDGNRLDPKLIAASSILVGLMNGVIEFGFDKAIQNIAGTFTGKLGKNAVRNAVKNGSVRKWALSVLAKYGQNMTSESMQEALQGFVSMVGGDYVRKKANEEGADFDTNSWDEYVKAMVDTAVQTAKGMAVVSLPSTVVDVVHDVANGDAGYMISADKYSAKSKTSTPVRMDEIFTGNTPADKTTVKLDTPADVVKVGNVYKPVSAEDAARIRTLKDKGARALNVEVSNQTAPVTEDSERTAGNIALATGAKHRGADVVLPTKGQAKEEAIAYALSAGNVTGFSENEDGSYTVVKGKGKGGFSVNFTASAGKDAEDAPSPRESAEGRGQATPNATEKTVTGDRSSSRRFENMIDGISETKDDLPYLKKTIVTPVANALMGRNPGLDADAAYDIGRSTAVWAKIVSNLAGESAQDFYGKNFTKDVVAIITPEMERKLKASAPFRESVEIDRRLNGDRGKTLGADARERNIQGYLGTNENGLKTIYIGKYADAVTVCHELAHTLVDAIQDTPKFGTFREIYADEIRKDGGKIGRNFQERFATDFETYLKEGKARNSKVREAMKAVTDAIRKLIGYVGRQLDDRTRKAFDDLLDMGMREERPETRLSKAIEAEASPDEIADAAAEQGKFKLRHGVSRMTEVLRKYGEAVGLSDRRGKGDEMSERYPILKPRWYLERITKAFPEMRDKISNGPVYIAPYAIDHIYNRHGDEGITTEDIKWIAKQIEKPVMLLKSASPNPKDRGGLLVVTDRHVDLRVNEGTGVKTISTPLVITLRPTEDGNEVTTMFPWKPYMQGGMSIEDSIKAGNLLAYDKNKVGASTLSLLQLREGERGQEAPNASKILDISELVKGESEVEFKVSPGEEEDQRQAVKDALKNHEYPADEVLREYADDPDVDWEMRFRRIIRQDPKITEIFDETYDSLVDENDGKAPAIDVVVKAFTKDASAEGIDAEEETGDVRRFVERMLWQEQYQRPTEADAVFLHNLSNDTFLTDVAKVLTDGVDYGEQETPANLLAVAREKNPTSTQMEAARKTITNDLRSFRRELYAKMGKRQQLSYEETVEGTALDGGHEVESFGNEEITSLLKGNADPVVKSLIRRNLASANSVGALLDEMDARKEKLEAEIGEQGVTIGQLQKKIGDAERNATALEGKYHDLQGKNSENYEKMRKYRRLLETMTRRRDLLVLRETLGKLDRQIKKTVKESSRVDVRMVDRAATLLSLLQDGTGSDVTNALSEAGITPETIPDELRPFFTQKDGKTYVETGYGDMDVRKLVALRNALRQARDNARAAKTERDQARRARVFPVIQEYMAQTRETEPESFDEHHAMMEDLKMEQGPRGTADASRQGQPHRFKAFVETQLITPSRLIRKIDGKPDGALYRFIFGGVGKDGKLTTGLEGVIDEEKRQEFARYVAAREKMKDLGITVKMLGRRLVETGGKKYTVDEAIGVYVYSQQADGLRHLLSPDGNRMTMDDIATVTSKLTDSQRAWGDWLIEEMGGRFGAVSDTYYKVHNKNLTRIRKYFPLVGDPRDSGKSFDDLMEDSYLNMQASPADSMTKERTGGDYMLRLDSSVIWSRMVRKQEHYIAGAEFFSDANYLMNRNGGDLYNLIGMDYGEKYAKGVQDFLGRVANRRNIQDDADTMANTVRNNLIVARLGFNMLSALKQFPTLALFLTKYGPVRFLEAIIHMTTRYRETTDFIYDLAPQIMNRNISTDYASLMDMDGRNAYQRIVRRIGEVGMKPIKWADDFVVNTLWYGAYQDTLAKTGDSEFAAMEATKWINDTQPGGSVKDSSAIYASTSIFWKYALMFTNQLNKNFNIAYDIPYSIRQKMYGQALRSAMGLGLSYAGIMMLEGGIRKDGEDDDEYVKRLVREFSAQVATTIPLFGGDISDALSGKYYSDSGLPMVSEAFAFAKALGSDDVQRRVDKAVRLGMSALELTGAPTGEATKVWNAFTKDNEPNWGYLLGSDFAK
jgi:hypothetical protein